MDYRDQQQVWVDTDVTVLGLVLERLFLIGCSISVGPDKSVQS